MFYSGGDVLENQILDRVLISKVANPNPQMTYIPYAHYESEVHFKEFVEQYQIYGIEKFIYFPVDVPFDHILLREVLKSDIIHLSGGNTFYFLTALKKYKMLPQLKKFAERGGILTGLSAGAIIMTPTIDTAAYPDFDCDDNFQGIRNFKSLNLVNFHFYPHYKKSKRYDDALILFSKKIITPLYACPDGAGIFLENNELRFIGHTTCFFEGKKFIINK